MTEAQEPVADFKVNLQSGQIFNINKPIGWTSFDVVKKVRNLVRNKTGHAGTLDPFASGVLLVCIGRATKSVEQLMMLEKEYVARIELGKTTDTYDKTGVILSEQDPSHLDGQHVAQACKTFVGELDQIPPMYSAVKVKGQRLYELARSGKMVERKPRKVYVHEIEIVEFAMPFLTLRIVCSRGTYIRSLASDLGERLGCGAYLESLTRTRIGPYKLEDALTVEDFELAVKKKTIALA